jgi:hypothetical protein
MAGEMERARASLIQRHAESQARRTRLQEQAELLLSALKAMQPDEVFACEIYYPDGETAVVTIVAEGSSGYTSISTIESGYSVVWRPPEGLSAHIRTLASPAGGADFTDAQEAIAHALERAAESLVLLELSRSASPGFEGG